MRTPTLRRLAVPALVALVLAAGCGDDGGDEAGTTSTTSTAADETGTTGAEGGDEGGPATTSSTEAGDGATTTEAGGDAEPDGDQPDPGDEPDAGGGQDEVGAADEEAPAVEWDLDATQYRGRDGTRVAFPCPPDGEIGSVRGTGTYTDDSSVCSAAVHAGLINPVEGGRVVIEIAPGQEAYEGSEANGVPSQDDGEHGGSFTFPTD